MVKEEIVTLKEHVDRRFTDNEKAIDAALAAQKEAVAAALAAAEKAVSVAETNAEKWRANANEWRGALSDRERDYLSRKEFYTLVGTAITVITFVLLIIKFK